MSRSRRGGVDEYEVISGGASNPLVIAGTADPSAGGGRAAPEGSFYLRFATGAGEVWRKTGAADTAWVRGQVREHVGEKWTQENVAATQTNVDLSAMVSTHFDDIKMIRAGSIVGLGTRFTEAITDANADSCLVEVTVNGVEGNLGISHSSGGNASGGQATQDPGVDTFSAGDRIGVSITTLGTFAPTTTDVEAWLEVAYDN